MGSAWTANHRSILRYKKKKIKVIQCYAPTNDRDEITKDQFCSRLQSTPDKCRTNYVTILIGDFNAETGMDFNVHEEVMGTHGVGQMNEHGETFADTCALNNIVIGAAFSHTKRYARPHGCHLIT